MGQPALVKRNIDQSMEKTEHSYYKQDSHTYEG